MRITPLEIRQHTFDKSFRGYDTESVDAFLLSLSQEWERVSEDFRQTKVNLEVAEREIMRMKEIENSLFKTLRAAEDAQQEINGKAQAEADLITDKAKKDAEEVANEAQKKADMVISEAENKAKFLVDDAVNDLKNYERDFKAMERYKDYLVVELKSFANDALDKVTKFEERINTRTNEARLNDLGIKATESTTTPPFRTEPKVEGNLVEIESVDEQVLEQRTIQTPVSQEVEEPVLLIIPDEKADITEPEVSFEPANDYDDENEELPTVHAVVYEDAPSISTEHYPEPIFENPFSKQEVKSEISTDLFSETADNLLKEMKATRGRPRKIVRENVSGLPTVSSVMEEFSRETPPSISNGGGSFFDNI
ncbi:MAG: DivIVA domain-containing protein [Arcicella sp.]|nr:DivIVA domain-containing protein [Arcicella sp.]